MQIPVTNRDPQPIRAPSRSRKRIGAALSLLAVAFFLEAVIVGAVGAYCVNREAKEDSAMGGAMRPPLEYWRPYSGCSGQATLWTFAFLVASFFTAAASLAFERKTRDWILVALTSPFFVIFLFLSLVASLDALSQLWRRIF